MQTLRRLRCPAICWLGWAALALITTLTLSAAPRPRGHPSLFFTADDLPGLRSHDQSTSGQAIATRLQSLLASEPEPLWRASHAAGWALRYTLQANPEDAAHALRLCEETIATGLVPAADTPHLPWASTELDPVSIPSVVGLALAYDLAAPAWPEERRLAIAQALDQAARQLVQRPLPAGTPPGAQWASQQAAGGLAALAVAPDLPDQHDLDSLARRARHHVLRYLNDCGDRGWPREHFAQLRLALSQSLPAFILAWRRTQGEDLAATSPARSWASLYTMLLLPPGKLGAPPDLAIFGRQTTPAPAQPAPPWEFSPWRGGDLIALFGLTDAGSRAALQWTFDRCYGLAGDRTFDIAKPGDALLALLLYPGAETALPPANTIGRGWRDDRGGLFICRNRWTDSGDAIATLTANARPTRALTSFADAGSFRLTAFGGHWAVARQHDTADLRTIAREQENVVVIPGTHGWFPGSLTYAKLQPDGSGAVTLDLSEVYTVASNHPERLDSTLDIGIRARRAWAIDYSGDCGAPVMLAVVDHISGGPTRRWLFHTGERQIQLRTDGFDIRAANGATLRATVIVPQKPRLSVSHGEWTSTLSIDGESDFFVVITVQPPDAAHPAIRTDGQGLDTHVRLGRNTLRYDGRALLVH
ncbi:MAG TPA: hypothetical protein PK879_03840 [Opitutaceae bacterium]|jgi:hypothetical protein|nr:hypothetical protein [Opitutaceae bacterium]MBP8962172.1 hypothetical protein [Opitutaceae bacterium]HOG93320.1 hypothetical protein [Opitutaceae bacterium]HOY53201.1 hypothetical protein [Opitutaceae bacterium]HPG18494.1 hypothetical protein [Opitutaceae bacterium]